MFPSLGGESEATRGQHRENAAELSVCMATYNGSGYVERQIRSILAELGPNDELVIVDDASTDDTLSVVLAVEDCRVRILTSPQNRGHVRAFERALLEAKGEFIFLSDQDDEWLPGRVEAMREALLDSDFVATNWESTIRNTEGTPKLRASDSTASFRNLVDIFLGKAPYFGCAMAVRAGALALVLPFPRWVEAHDHWIAIAGNVTGSMRHLDAPSVRRTIHQGNLTPSRRRSLPLVLRTRFIMSWLVIVATLRLLKLRVLK